MASKKRSVLFEKNSSGNAKNNAETSDPEPSSRSGTYPATDREGSPRVTDSPDEARLKEAAAVEAFVVAHILSRF